MGRGPLLLLVAMVLITAAAFWRLAVKSGQGVEVAVSTAAPADFSEDWDALFRDVATAPLHEPGGDFVFATTLLMDLRTGRPPTEDQLLGLERASRDLVPRLLKIRDAPGLEKDLARRVPLLHDEHPEVAAFVRSTRATALAWGFLERGRIDEGLALLGAVFDLGQIACSGAELDGQLRGAAGMHFGVKLKRMALEILHWHLTEGELSEEATGKVAALLEEAERRDVPLDEKAEGPGVARAREVRDAYRDRLREARALAGS